MHELSIARSIVQLSEQQAREHHSSQIEEVELEIGRLAGVELQTLEFAMESAVKGTLLEKAKDSAVIAKRSSLSGICFLPAPIVALI